MNSNKNRDYFKPETIIVVIENIDGEQDFVISKLKTKEQIPWEVTKIYLGNLFTLNTDMDKNCIFDAYLL